MAAGAALRASALPQSSQNTDEGAFSAPHFGQRAANGPPHTAQNFLLVVLSFPHLVHCIALPRLEAGMSCITRRREQTDSRTAPEGAAPIRVAGPKPTQVADEKLLLRIV